MLSFTPGSAFAQSHNLELGTLECVGTRHVHWTICVLSSVSDLGLGDPGEGLACSRGFCYPLCPRLTEPPFSLPGSMADSPREGKPARSLDFTRLVDMASESVGGEVSGGLTARRTLQEPS